MTLRNNQVRYSQILEHLQKKHKCFSPSLINSVCPKNTKAVLSKFIRAGVAEEDLTDAVSTVYQYEKYDETKHEPAKLRSENDEWLVSNDGTIFFVRNPFQELRPSHVLQGPDAQRIQRIGLLPISLEQSESQEKKESIAESEKMIDRWLKAARKKEATDVHITPLNSSSVRISFRIDGQVTVHEDMHFAPVDSKLYHYVSNTLMRYCNLEAAVYSTPQDGSFQFGFNNESLEVRLSMRPVNVQGSELPGFWLRLLNAHQGMRFPSLESLSLPAIAYEALKYFSGSSQNLILITGPTGSGKSTTLYSTLLTIQRDFPNKSIQTLEDPVEVHLDGITQTQINPDAGMTFAEGIRAMMRSDVDVILVGEIRDEETAKLAVRASLTGHLVLATLHCKTAVEAIGRLMDLNVSPSMIANVLAFSMAQRLVRKVRPECSERLTYADARSRIPIAQMDQFIEPDSFVSVESSTPEVADYHTNGYKGRQVVVEALPISKQLRYQIMKQDPQAIDECTDYAITLWEHGALLVTQGETTLEECARTLPMHDSYITH